ncbi:9051_t:CDS:2, partial [Entrophospora sp. SA101]
MSNYSSSSKRKLGDRTPQESRKIPKHTDFVSSNSHVVERHYNEKREEGREKRMESKILRLRNFNNWLKSVLIGKHMAAGNTVLDIGCGKGGDLNKWDKAEIHKYYGFDLAQKSIEDAKKRWEVLSQRGSKIKQAEFYVLDYIISDEIKFDIVSMQFCLHYSFESEEKVRMALKNVTSGLKIGGYFIGTVPNAYRIVKILKSLPDNELEFGNSIYSIKFEQKESYPLYGNKYWFNLEESIDDCPEYLVYFPVFEKLAKEYGLKLLYKKSFHDLYEEEKKNDKFYDLLFQMQVIGKRPDDSKMTDDEWEAI